MVNNIGPLCSVRVVDGMPRAGSHYNLGTSHGPDKIGSRARPGPRAAGRVLHVVGLKAPGPVDIPTELMQYI